MLQVRLLAAFVAITAGVVHRLTLPLLLLLLLSPPTTYALLLQVTLVDPNNAAWLLLLLPLLHLNHTAVLFWLRQSLGVAAGCTRAAARGPPGPPAILS